jgi:hypothetical protein
MAKNSKMNRLALGAAAAILMAGCSLIADVGQFDNATAADDGAAASPEPDGEVADGSRPPGPDGAAEGASTIDARDPTDSGGAGDTFVSDFDGDDAAASSKDSGDATAPSTDSGDATTAPPTDSGAPSSDAGDSALGEVDAADSAALVQDAGNDAPALTWCAAHVSATTLDCHDFDEGNPAAQGFSSNYYSTIFAAVTSSDYVPGSAPSSLLLSTPLLDAGGPWADEQFNDVVSYHDKLELTFSLKIVNFQATSGDVSLFRISYKNSDWAVSLDYQGTTAALNESATFADGGTYVHAHQASLPTFTNWTTVDVLVDFVDQTIAMTYDGVSIVPSQAIESPTQNNPQLFVQSGLNYLASPAKPMMIYYDNIILSAPP